MKINELTLEELLQLLTPPSQTLLKKVAVPEDGVKDPPAPKKAYIGIVMESEMEVVKEFEEMIILA